MNKQLNLGEVSNSVAQGKLNAAADLARIDAVLVKDPTPHEVRNMLVAGAEDFKKKFPEPSPEEAVDNFLATRDPPTKQYDAEQLVAEAFANRPGSVPPTEDDSVFKWKYGEDSVVLWDQPATACYFNQMGQVVIRQEMSWNEENDPIIRIAPANLEAVILKLQAMLKEIAG